MAVDPLAVRSYYGILSGNITTKISLATLIANAYNALNPAQNVPNLTALELRLWSIAANSPSVLVGDANVSTTNYAHVMPASTERRYGPQKMSAIPIEDIFVMSSDNSTAVKLGIEIIPA